MSRALAIAAIAACGAFGVYGTLYTGFQNGLFDAITVAVRPGEVNYPGGPLPYRTVFTGVAPIDRQLTTLVAFFVIMVDGARAWDVTLADGYFMAQFCAGWSVIALEGYRAGNRGKLVSWTGTVGVILQNVTYTLCIPLYLITHLLSSPVAYLGRDRGSSSSLAVSSADIMLLPFMSFFSFWVPAGLMALPSPSVLSPEAHYGWIAFWQVFPMWQSIWNWLLKQPLRSRAVVDPVKVHLQTVGWAYSYIIVTAIAAHVTVLGIALTPESVVPEDWAPVFAQVNLSSTVVPRLPWNSPTVDVSSSQPSSNELGKLARLFCQWDVHCTNTAILVWAVYLYLATTRKPLASVLLKVAFWGLLGGPVAAAAAILWDRDNLMIDREFAEKKSA